MSACETLNRGARFVLFVLLARGVGPGPYGSWVIASSIGVLLMTVGDLGIATVIAARVAGRNRSCFGSTPQRCWLWPRWSSSLPAERWSGAGAGLLGTLVVLLGMAGLIDSSTFLLLAPLRARGDARPESIIRAAQGAALAAVGLPLLALTSTGVQGLAISFLGVSLGCLLLAALTLRRALGPLSPVLRIDLIHELASAGAPVLGQR